MNEWINKMKIIKVWLQRLLASRLVFAMQ